MTIAVIRLTFLSKNAALLGPGNKPYTGAGFERVPQASIRNHPAGGRIALVLIGASEIGPQSPAAPVCRRRKSGDTESPSGRAARIKLSGMAPKSACERLMRIAGILSHHGISPSRAHDPDRKNVLETHEAGDEGVGGRR